MLIGLTGFARSGKDTSADFIMQAYSEVFERYALADPLKKAASEMFGVPLEYFYDDEYKEEVIDEWGMSPREMIQLLGTEGVRNVFGEDFWIRRAKHQLNNATSRGLGLIITDVRFNNEADWIRENGTLIHIKREGAAGNVGKSNHASEAGVTLADDDYIVYNNYSLQELQDTMEEVVKMVINDELG